MPGPVLRTSFAFYMNTFNPCNKLRGLVLVLIPLYPEETEAQKDEMKLSCLRVRSSEWWYL